MKIKLVSADQEAAFIRHARTETLKSIGEEPTAAAIEPSPFALYFIAYDESEDGGRPIGMAEVAFLDQVYESFADSPYPDSLDLDQFGPVSEVAGIRTIYVEPDYRLKAGSLYMQLIYAGGRLVTSFGARFGTASTNASDTYLNRLYRKTGGREMAPFHMVGCAKCEVALYVFDLDQLMNHKLMDRAAAGAEFEIDMQVAQTIRSRTIWNLDERKCA